jgi:2Fe-2S ferredoxin
VWVEAGEGSLSEIEEREDDKLQEAAGLSARSRLGCQARVGAEDVLVRIPGNRVKA